MNKTETIQDLVDALDDVGIKDVPVSARDAIREEMKLKGFNVTDDEIVEIYGHRLEKGAQLEQ